MRNSSIGLASRLVAMAVQRGGSPYGRRKVSSAHFYPEQSTRQEMRGHRRAQGDPGIALVGTRYLERD